MAKKKAQKVPTLRITQVRSTIGNTQKHRDMMRTLGLKKINQVVERPATPDVLGILRQVNHLVSIEEVE